MWKKRYSGIFFLIVLTSSFSLRAQHPYTPETVNPLTQSWRWEKFPEMEGKGIRNIFEADDRTVWVSYNEGIYEYNGYDWKNHNHENGLDSSPIELVYVSKAGIVYAASPSAIYQLKGTSWVKLFEAPENLPFTFDKLTEFPDGSIAAPSDRGLVVLGDRVKIYSSEQRIAAMRSRLRHIQWVALPNELTPDDDFLDISDVLVDHNGQIWMAITMTNERGRLLTFSIDELLKKHISRYKVITSDSRIQLGESQQLLEAQDGAVWVINTTYKTGISIFRNSQWEYINLSDQFSGDEYMADIEQTDDGTIWIGSLGKLYAYKNGRWALYTAPNYPIPANRLILEAGHGNYIWVAGYKSKVFYLDFSFDRWVSYDGLNFQFQEASGTNWFLDVDGRVVRQKGNNWEAYGVEEGLMDAPIRIVQTNSGQVWAAGSHKGVAATALLKDSRWETNTHPYLSWGIDYRAVFEDRSGSLWFGGAVDAEIDKGQKGGVLKLVDPLSEKKEWLHFAYEENGLQQSNVYGIGQSADGRIWIGGGNLFGYDGERWQRHVDSRLQQFVNVVKSEQGMLMAGSRYYGVFIFDGQQWRNYDNSNGLSGNTVISLDALAPDCIYVATENDICRFDGSGWVKNVFPQELNMDFEGGMLLHDNQGAIWVNKASRSWKRRAFSHNKTQKGEEYCFVAHKYIPDNTPPQTYISMYTTEVSPAGNSLIEWGGNDYFAQSAKEELMYSYKLGNEDWSPFSKEDHFTFMGLDNGDYTLQVRARDLDLNVDPNPAIIEFTVLPPVWKQTWFILLLLAFLAVLSIFEYRIITKKRKLEILNNSLQRVNEKLKSKGEKIASQNQEILTQQKYILEQAKGLETANKYLEERNVEIKKQKDQLEEMIVQVEELSRAKIGFFTNISHELRTPLTLISGPISQLVRQDSSLTEASRQNLYLIIERNADRLLKLINQLLEMRRIEKSNLELHYARVSLPDFIGQIIGLFENLAIEKNIYLDFIDQTRQTEFFVDPDKMEKIIVNLLSNAFKHTPSGQSILVKMNMVSAQVACLAGFYDDCLEITVEDTGCGIREEDIDHIYERFFASELERDNPNSSGIGLSYTRELVRLMQGDIQVESKLGEGSRFKVYLPCIHVPPSKMNSQAAGLFEVAKKEAASLMYTLPNQDDKQAVGMSVPIERKKILVVEDHTDMQLFVESILAGKYEVLKADNGIDGLKKANTHNIDLIISDVMMPEMDGLTFCNKIKSNAATSHIPILLLTAKVMDENVIKGFEEGADAYLTKPFNPDLLLARIENLLEQREMLRAAFNRDFMLTPEKIQLTSPDEELLKKIVDIMEENLEDTDFNVNQMCKMVHLSHMHFIRKVKQLTGKKPIDLLKSFRLKRAKDLLAQNKLSISEIAYKVGYDLPNSFSRAFKKEFGLSPKEFMSREPAEQEKALID